MPRVTDLLPRFSLRALVLAVAAMAVGFGALFHPSPFVETLISNAVYVAILVAACLAIGLPQPRRSFWLAFAVTTTGFLVVHKLSYSRYVTDAIFTRQLTSVIDDLLPEIVVAGDSNATVYFRYDSNSRPIFYRRFDQNGQLSGVGFLTEEEAQDKGVLSNGKTLAGLPHYDHQPAAAARRQLLPFFLAALSGLVGGLLASGVRHRCS